MNLSDVESRLVPWYLASLEDNGASYHLVSQPGLGKSSIIRLLPGLLAARNPGKRYGVVVINGATVTLVTVTGYLVPITVDEQPMSRFSLPNWWTTREGNPLTAYDGGVVFWDELDKTGTDEKKLYGEAALEKIFGTHRLPPGWVVWSAGNRSTDRSGSTKEFDFNINRRFTIEVKPHTPSLLNWMGKNGCMAETKYFAEENPQVAFMPAPEVQGPWCTPRSLAQTDAYLRVLMRYQGTDKIPLDSLTIEEMGAILGPGAAQSYVTSIRTGQEMPPYADIIKSPTSTGVPAKPDIKRLAMYKMAAQVSAADMRPALTYVKRFPDEFQVMFGLHTGMRDPRLTLQPDYKAWAGSHAQLLALLVRMK